MTYAATTTVPISKSRIELDEMLRKAGAAQRMTGDDEAAGLAVVGFVLGGFHVQLKVPLPKRASVDPNHTGERPRGWHGWTAARKEAWVTKELEQASRSRWRAVVLLVKAKLEAIAFGISTVDREFLADVRLPGNKTVHGELFAELRLLQEGKVKMLPLLGGGS